MTKTLEQAVAEAIHDADVLHANYGDLAQAAIKAVREWDQERAKEYLKSFLESGGKIIPTPATAALHHQDAYGNKTTITGTVTEL